MEYGMDKMDMDKWSHVTGYKPPTLEEKLEAESMEARKIVVGDDLLSKDELDEFIEMKTANHVPEDSIFDQEATTVVAFNPPEVKWEQCNAEELKQNMDPFFFSPDISGQFTEFVMDLALFIDTSCAPEQWKKKLKPYTFEPYNKEVRLSPTLVVDYWASRVHHAFLLLLFSQLNKKLLRLHSYFFLQPKEPRPVSRPEDKEEENISIMEMELFT
jgi:hypothetical protein